MYESVTVEPLNRKSLKFQTNLQITSLPTNYNLFIQDFSYLKHLLFFISFWFGSEYILVSILDFLWLIIFLPLHLWDYFLQQIFPMISSLLLLVRFFKEITMRSLTIMKQIYSKDSYFHTLLSNRYYYFSFNWNSFKTLKLIHFYL